ncbi:MAG: hypothetical protein IJP87_02805, partial [Campylobacter sp.]|nr:hypothetical protein [Campylobacter sp.]
EDEIEISVGNINATKDAPYYAGQSNRQGNMVWSRTVATTTGNIDEAFISTNTTYRLPFGGWYVVLVYDKTQRAQQELYSNPSKIGANSDSEVKEHINKFFKPKNVSIYDGYLALEPPIPAEYSNAGLPEPSINQCAIGVDYDITGFFTPKSGAVQGKFIIGNFGANRGYYTDTTGLEGIFLAKNKADVDRNRLPNDGKYHTKSLFNGSKTWLELDDDGSYNLKGITGNTETTNRGYHQAYDLDEFDISKSLSNSQSSLAVRLRMLPDTRNTTNRAFVPFIGVSIDIYVPRLCYMVDIYDTAGWLGFFDKNTGERKPKTAADIKQIEKLYGDRDTGTVVDRPIVAGENLFFRVKFYNQPGDSEDATGVWVKPMWNSNTYQPNSSAIDNTLSKAELADADAFVYLKDNAMGAYSNMSDVFKNADPDKFKNRKFMTNDSEGVKYYIGSGAGEIQDNTPVGGLLPIGKTAFVEFNATTGRTYAYRPIKYTVGYRISIAGGEPIQGPSYEMDECKDPGTPIKLSVLNGLQVVNQNFEDLGHDTESDIEKTNSQDDRLFTQIAELPFNANLIFRPNAEEIFPCKEKGVDGKCADYGSIDGKSVCESFKELFVLQNNKCVRKTDDEAKARFKDMDGGLKDFKLPGKLYLSAIRSGFYGACSLIGDSDKLPFKIKDEKNYILNYETGFSEYQKQHNTKILPLEELEIGDAFNGVTFM